MTWTQHEGQPVYWLAPQFWNPRTGHLCLLLPGEEAWRLSTEESIQRKIEFLKLQGDPRYVKDPEERVRMRRLMRERLGSETPWRDIEPVNAYPMEVPGEPEVATGCPF